MQAPHLWCSSVDKVTNLRITSSEVLPSPVELCGAIPRTSSQNSLVREARNSLHALIKGEDRRLLAVVGPCSIHDLSSCREYAERFAGLAKELKDRLMLTMRVYFEKPRTTVGWKGLIMDPQLNGSCDIPEGLRIARKFLGEVLDLGIPTATELLDPITPQYIADSLCWSAIGARTSESQTHRQMASGLSMPVGFKNATSGNVKTALNAILAASQEQTFLGIDRQGQASAVTTAGNPDCHLILRGGENGINYDEKSVREAQKNSNDTGLVTPVMIDCSHANSGKDPANQPAVLKEIVRQFKDPELRVSSAMIESNLRHGNQKFPPTEGADLEYGISITDGCIDWETTESILREAHSALAG